MTEIAQALKKEGKTMSMKKNRRKKTKVKTEKVWTQVRLKARWAESWVVDPIILRQPRDEVCVVQSKEYLGTRRVVNNTYGGAYDAHYWRVVFLTEMSSFRDFPIEGALEIPCGMWKKNAENGNIPLEPQEMIGTFTITASKRGGVFVVEEGIRL